MDVATALPGLTIDTGKAVAEVSGVRTCATAEPAESVTRTTDVKRSSAERLI
jgi:hypothetical protein